MVAVTQLDVECILADVGGHATELEGLEDGPVEKVQVSRAKLAERLGHVLVDGDVLLLLCGGHHGGGVLADSLVRRPVALLAIRRAILMNKGQEG